MKLIFRVYLFYFFILFIIINLFSCSDNSNKKTSNDGDFDIPDSLYEEQSIDIEENQTANIIYNISSPIEMASLIKKEGIPFSTDYLSQVEDKSVYNNEFKKAIALGILSADLGYLNIYNQNTSILSYISFIRDLAEDIKVGQFFDFSTLKRLAMNNDDLDALIKISVSSFNKMDEHLRKNDRGRLSALLISGVWIEGLYLATQVVKQSKSHEIKERIGEQKLVLNELLSILGNYKSDGQVQKLINNFKLLETEFNKIKITYEVGEPESIEENGMFIIVQNEKSIINIPKGQMKIIVELTKKIRNQLTSS